MTQVPDNLKYNRTHEWTRLEDDGTLTIGITDHAQSELGDLVFVETPTVGRHYDAEEACAVVESVKAASDIYAPVGGEVIEANSELQDSPELVNTDPYGEGWIMRIRPDDSDDLEQLLDPEDYQDLVADEE
ncbi:glycine cleavage system protein GcvH [Alkalilimnicola ehrlichii MLHE-1]|uniref:Glycine cleavage system H protein n=1 Tax=Alkalilimnicola ehrlichii (strain ATCC BAA-1101 / DSM 17681 / MLHE-1) TaxID=187272 RepID=GCSH_ALKEH|nr:glycine cleavage system protein GcvH [Alkalilimnicola ehrlichii]Q0A5H0.1 RecName: Full=Glycine cleavage system H protein [Alkalilimnicola ehrlichii MLHE-1]ABI57917.1 glycine cleavage system H protein [Alkalilimnicola ehrlichii MLHE-1]